MSTTSCPASGACELPPARVAATRLRTMALIGHSRLLDARGFRPGGDGSIPLRPILGARPRMGRAPHGADPAQVIEEATMLFDFSESERNTARRALEIY